MAAIKVYARVRPCKRPSDRINHSEGKLTAVTGTEVKEATLKHSSTPKLQHEFQFTHVFNASTNQEDVFETVGKEIAVNFLDGYNGTIFAYGQTGSGKTYTMEGSARRFSERGLIPRVLSFVYGELEKRSDKEELTVHITYMEIYQDTGYDLLNPGNTADSLMTELPKISVVEGTDGNVKVKNLSLHLAANEEVAQNLLFQGRMNRKVAETSMNLRSSRSHAIFTIMLTATTPRSDIITRSKLHLVDLAGSERVSKTGADGKVLLEAKYINLSLHYLEHVIVLLQRQAAGRPNSVGGSTRRSHSSHDRSKLHTSPVHHSSPKISGRHSGRKRLHSSHSLHHDGFIPYRNSLLTMVLKDSLGGNCLTAMIATLSVEESNLGESISTCRFSQRVACIANTVRRNEELDDKAVIRRLKCRVAELENELAQLKRRLSVEQNDYACDATLTETETKNCHRVLYDFLHGKLDNPVEAGINDSRKFAECLNVLKQIVLHALGVGSKGQSTSPLEKDSKQQQDHLLKQSLPIQTPSKESAHKSSSNSRTAPTAHSSSTQVSSVTSTAQENNHQHYYRNRDSIEISASKTPLNKFIQHTPTPSSLASSGIGSLAEEEAVVTKPNTQHSTSVFPIKPDFIDCRHDNTLSPAHDSKRHRHRHQRTKSDRNFLTQGDSDTAKIQQSKSEHHLLKNEVQQLTLSVEEEEVKGQIAILREQIAGQHARILWMERCHASSEELHQEKLAEYHLRIKEAKWQQKLLQISQQLNPRGSSGSKSQQLSKQLNDELRSYSEKQDKMQQELEELKQVQLDKQLQLKEAATRQKLLVLKQQLKSDTRMLTTKPKNNQNAQTSDATANKTTNLPVTPKTAQSEITNHTKADDGNVQLSMSMDGKWPSTIKCEKIKPHEPTTTKGNSVNITANKQDKRSKYQSSTFSSLLPDTFKPTSASDKQLTTGRKSVTVFDDTKQATPPYKNDTPTPIRYTNENINNDLKSTDTQVTASTAPSTHKPVVQHRLAVPDTVKETEYMSALNKQKARVSRIRRAIHAAEVIQKAWRKYKQIHS